VWLGTTRLFDAFTFAFVETEWGWFQAHAYRFDATHSTFIVETPDSVWRAAGLESMSKEEGIAFCERLFAPWLDGHPLVSNAQHLRGSASWIRFPRIVCERWVQPAGGADGRTPVVLMGDAAHTAHFSIGSGTKLALEDAIDLSTRISDHAGNLDAALARTAANAASRSSRSRTRPATRPNGSSTSTGTSGSIRNSSPTRC
jgi:anthraniloyl-CoA monooxygenase